MYTDSDTLQSQLWSKREKLRNSLLNRVERSNPARPRVECCYCWKLTPLNDRGFDLHEIVISRQIVRSLPDEAQLAIHTRANCGWVHSGLCHQRAEGGDNRLLTLVYLIKHEGVDNVRDFVLGMGDYLQNTSEFMLDINRANAALNRLLYANRQSILTS